MLLALTGLHVSQTISLPFWQSLAATDKMRTRLQCCSRTLIICNKCCRHRWRGHWHTLACRWRTDETGLCDAYTRLKCHWCMCGIAGYQGHCLVVHWNQECSQLLCHHHNRINLYDWKICFKPGQSGASNVRVSTENRKKYLVVNGIKGWA